MQRDFDLVVSLLGALRDSPLARLSGPALHAAAQAPGLAEPSEEAVLHHLALLEDAGFVKRLEDVISTDWRLTWAGYDALEGNDEEEDDEDEAGEYDEEDEAEPS